MSRSLCIKSLPPENEEEEHWSESEVRRWRFERSEGRRV